MLPFGTRIPPRTLVLAWHRDRYRSQAAQAFVELAQELANRSGPYLAKQDKAHYHATHGK